MGADSLAQVGLVVHPRRDVDAALDTTRDWASTHGIALGQVQINGQTRRVGEPVDAASCDLLLALGGDGTALAALHASAPPFRDGYATAVTLAGQESMLAGRRRRAWSSIRRACWCATGARLRQTSSRKTISVESDLRGPNLRMRV
jgi:hypothetical protein